MKKRVLKNSLSFFTVLFKKTLDVQIYSDYSGKHEFGCQTNVLLLVDLMYQLFLCHTLSTCRLMVICAVILAKFNITSLPKEK